MIPSELNGSSVVQVRLGPPGWSMPVSHWAVGGHWPPFRAWSWCEAGLDVSPEGTGSSCGLRRKWAQGGQEEGDRALNCIEQGMGLYFWVSKEEPGNINILGSNRVIP